jgi:signal transduction histidine kinase
MLGELRAPARTEWERLRPDAESQWLSASASVVRDRHGIPQGGLLLIDDVTETKRLRDAAGLNDRLLAVGEMSAGIAHEIKNSLHALMGHANLLREDHPGEEPMAVRGILGEVQSLQALVMGILEFSKPTRLLREIRDLNEVLAEALETVRARAESVSVTLGLELAGDLPKVRVDAASLRHAFLNCAHNAIEAMEAQAGGTLTVSTRTAELREETENGDGASRRPAVRVSFRDTGPGIAEADRRRIFTPFFSTKRDGHGLGLAFVHRTITAHGGRVQLHSRPGVGTELVMLIPAEDAE